MNSHYKLMPLILAFMISAPWTGWAGANPNAPYCEHDPACWVPNDDPSTWYGADCCRPVPDESCVYVDSPLSMPSPDGSSSTTTILPTPTVYDASVGTYVSYSGTITRDKTTTYSAQNRATREGPCHGAFIDSKTINQQTATLSVGLSGGLSSEFISVGISLSYDIPITWGGDTYNKYVSGARCRKHCGTRFDIYKHVGIAIDANMTKHIFYAQPLQMPWDSTAVNSREEPDSVVWEISAVRCPE
ncbi:MAG: hypothetical protein AB7V14_11785 [Kiritimatiellia bacterium]